MDYITGSCGYRIMESSLLVKDGEPYEEKRTLKERLFSLPWKPFKATKIIIPKIPSDEAVIMGNTVLMHPEAIKALRESEIVNDISILNPPRRNIQW